MARNGVWELRNVLLRYCASGGSSRGVREYVERGLVPFAERNPQIEIRTEIKSGHPCIYGDYITGYKRQRTLANLPESEVGEVLQELRDTLGRKVPRHNEISRGVVERKKLSVQGVWRNRPNLNFEIPGALERRRKIRETMRFQDLVDHVGLAGVVDIMQTALQKRDEEELEEVAKLPREEKVWPTE